MKKTVFFTVFLLVVMSVFGQEIDFAKYREISLFDYRVQENTNGNIFYGYFKMTLYFVEQRSTQVIFKDEYGDVIRITANTRLPFRDGQMVYVYFHAKRSGWDNIRKEYRGDWTEVTLDYILEAQYPFSEIVIDINYPPSFVGQSATVLQRTDITVTRILSTNNYYSDIYSINVDDTSTIELYVHEGIIGYVKYIRKHFSLRSAKEGIIEHYRNMLGKPVSSNEDDISIRIMWWSNPNISRSFMNTAIEAYHIYYDKENQELIEIWDITSG